MLKNSTQIFTTLKMLYSNLTHDSVDLVISEQKK